VDYWWLAPTGVVQSSRGTTLDISSGGVMIIARKCPPAGVRIQATIHVARRDGSDRPLELHGEGIVVRVEPDEETQPGRRSKGFAATLHFYSELSNASDDSDQDTQEISERRTPLTAGRLFESSGHAGLFRRSRGSEL
jgi:hypothetical protein